MRNMLVKTGFGEEKWPRYTVKIICCINRHIALFLIQIKSKGKDQD